MNRTSRHDRLIQPLTDDLRWNLQDLKRPDRALALLREFRSSFCVYSSEACQLHADYDLMASCDLDYIDIMPGAMHDTFYDIPAECVVATGIKIFPGEIIESSGRHIAWRESDSSGIRVEKLGSGLSLLLKGVDSVEPFLPVLMRGDLREFVRNSQPYLHLHRLSPAALAHNQTRFMQMQVRETIRDKVSTLLVN